jgi:hypothetical protein
VPIVASRASSFRKDLKLTKTGYERITTDNTLDTRKPCVQNNTENEQGRAPDTKG